MNEPEVSPNGGMFVSLVYNLLKDAVRYLESKELAPKLVDRAWLDLSGMGKKYEAKGVEVRWSAPEKLETRLLLGYEILYEIDELRRTRRRIVRRDGLTLVGKSVAEE